MNINSIQPKSGFNLVQTLQETQIAEQKNSETLSLPESKANGFMPVKTEVSRYRQASLANLSLSNQLRNNMNSNVTSLLDKLGGINYSGTFNPNPISPSKAKKAAMEEMTQKVMDSSQEVLDEIKKKIEEAVEEVMQPENAIDPENTPEPIKPVEKLPPQESTEPVASDEAALVQQINNASNSTQINKSINIRV